MGPVPLGDPGLELLGTPLPQPDPPELSEPAYQALAV